jgi:hypothetical protein
MNGPKKYYDDTIDRIRAARRAAGVPEHICDADIMVVGQQDLPDGSPNWELRDITETWGGLPLAGTIREYRYVPRYPGSEFPRDRVEVAAYRYHC